MKSDIDIQDDVFNYLQGNHELWSALSEHKIYPDGLVKDARTEGAENTVVSILANGGNLDEIQEAFVNVNIFIKDLENVESAKGAGEVTTYYRDTKRCRAICRIVAEHLTTYGADFRIELDEQRVLKDEATHTHFVNNKLLYKSINL